MPFDVPWTVQESPLYERQFLQFYWRHRAEWKPENWTLSMVVVVDGRIVGTQAISAIDLAGRKTMETGSWLAMSEQGNGLGKEMRAAVLHFAFAGLGALRSESGAMEDNVQSIAVSRGLGYVECGDRYIVRQGQRTRQIRFAIEREAWETGRRDDIEIEGWERCMDFFLATPDG